MQYLTVSPLASFSHLLFYPFLCYFLGEAGEVEDEEKGRLLIQFQEKSSEVAQLKKQLEDLQRTAELDSQGHSLLVKEMGSYEREQLQVRST